MKFCEEREVKMIRYMQHLTVNSQDMQAILMNVGASVGEALECYQDAVNAMD